MPRENLTIQCNRCNAPSERYLDPNDAAEINSFKFQCDKCGAQIKLVAPKARKDIAYEDDD